MPRLDRPSRGRVTLWRHTSLLLVASLFSLLSSQPFHERLAPEAASCRPALVASAGAEGGLPSHSGAHDRDTCVQCRAVAQTRLGVRAPAHGGALVARGPALALHLEAPECPLAAPEPCVSGPRAPPALLPV